jgi:ACR3 family arsenite efflux pump ArsB
MDEDEVLPEYLLFLLVYFMNFKEILTFPSRYLVYVIPVVVSIALLLGSFIDTTPLAAFTLPVAMMAIYPTMIGLQLGELVKFNEWRLMWINLILNFLVLPILAFAVGTIFLSSWPELKIGLLIISVIPGGTMAIAFTMLFSGNVKASVKLCTINLILGALLAPVYLFILAGKVVEIDIFHIGSTIAIVVFIPLIAGIITYRLLLVKYSEKQFKKSIKPLLPAFSAWAMIYIIFTNMSMKATMIFSYPALLVNALLSLIVWYALVVLICAVIGRLAFNRTDAIALLMNVELRNLTIAMGLAVTAFSPQTAMMVALAFLFQQQAVIWFYKFDEKTDFFTR